MWSAGSQSLAAPTNEHASCQRRKTSRHPHNHRRGRSHHVFRRIHGKTRTVRRTILSGANRITAPACRSRSLYIVAAAPKHLVDQAPFRLGIHDRNFKLRASTSVSRIINHNRLTSSRRAPRRNSLRRHRLPSIFVSLLSHRSHGICSSRHRDGGSSRSSFGRKYACERCAGCRLVRTNWWPGVIPLRIARNSSSEHRGTV